MGEGSGRLDRFLAAARKWVGRIALLWFFSFECCHLSSTVLAVYLNKKKEGHQWGVETHSSQPSTQALLQLLLQQGSFCVYICIYPSIYGCIGLP